MKAFLLKVDDAQYIQWQAKAKAAQVSMSEWIRMSCNESCLRILPSDVPIMQAIVAEHEYNEAVDNITTEIQQSIAEKLGRKPCKHGLLFCKKCA